MQDIFYNPHVVAEKMDRYSSKGIPFLFAMNYELDEALFIPYPAEQDRVLYHFPNGTNSARDLIPTTMEEHMKVLKVETEEEYARKFNIIIKGLKRGDSYLANLTCKSEVSTNLDASTLYRSTHSPFGLYVPEKFLSFSPERFVRIENGIISSLPMKGTIDASLPNAEVLILEDYKESCEHATITDLIRNDLGIVSDDVWVERYRFIDKICTDRGDILQVSSEIRGRLKREYAEAPGKLMLSLLPAGSTSGAPKSSTIKLISEAEKVSRGFYTGVAGLFDGIVLDSAVLIRFIEFNPDGRAFYRSGGGITVNSRLDEEYREMVKKIYLPLNR